MTTTAKRGQRYRSLYWRAAVSFVLLVTGLVAAQFGMSWWLLVRDTAARVNRRNETLSAATALGAALAKDPQLVLSDYLRRLDPTDGLFVIMRDGRVVGIRRPPPVIIEGVLDELGNKTLTAVPATWRSSGYSAAGIMVDGRLVGVIGLVRLTTFEEYRTPILVLGVCVLVGGALLTGVLAFGPTRRRLRDLENAARRLETGELSVRAPESGNDEVTRLAMAFNSMAAGLAKHESDREASDRAHRQLVADVSHELMTPLTAIRGYLETLAMSGIKMDTFTRQQQVAVARREAQRLERLIGDLLDTARLEARGGHLELSRISVQDLFERVAEHHEPECRTRGIRWQQSISPTAQAVTADAFRLEQALINVTTNAFRHTPDRGVVRLRSERVDEMIVLSVVDTGEGIPPEHLPLIFDRFHRVPSSRAPSRGSSGLGLAIVKAIVERHGGCVKAESTLGKGTTISLSFPLQNVTAPQVRSRIG